MRRIEGAISAGNVDITVAICRDAGTRHPEPSQAAVGSGHQKAGAREVGCVVGKQPAVIGAGIAVGSEGDVDLAIQ